MDEMIDRAVDAAERSLRKDGVELECSELDEIRDEIQRVLEDGGYLVDRKTIVTGKQIGRAHV